MTVRLIVLGTGSMANNHVEAFKAVEGVEIVAGVDTRPLQLDAFCDKHQIEHRFATLDEAIAWGGFDAATNVTPDSTHYATTMALLKAGKHVLCEKPLSTDYAKAREMADAAKAAGVVNMINLSYRNGAALQRAAEMVAKGTIGPVRHFEASYLQSWLTQAAWGDWRTEPQWLWRLSSKHGSKGVLGDVGIHILDYATFIAGSFPVSISGRLKTFDKAEGNRIGEYDLDVNDSFVCHLELASGAMGTITATRFASGHHNDLKLSIYGDGGGLEVRHIQGESKLLACLGSQDMATQTWREIATPDVKKVYQVFIEAINGEGPMIPDFERGAALQFLLDAAEESDRQKGASVDVALA